MCGIAGYISCRKNTEVDLSVLRAMAQKIAHRGPDGDGFWVNTQRTVGFAHRRLSIIDLSSVALQPMVSERHRVVITFNGEIYNYQEIRAQLIGYGYQFFSQSDTEVLLYAYRQWGMAMLDRLEGMFAFALYDMRSDELFLVRDRFGVKPLYFSLQAGYISFASEIKALWAIPGMHKKINSAALAQYLTYLVAPAPLTAYDGIYKIPAGFYLRISHERTISYHQWYELAEKITGQNIPEKEALEITSMLLEASVKKRLIADVEVGIFLSGGVDSSLITALASRNNPHIKTFHVFSPHDSDDERTWARAISQKFGTEHFEYELSLHDAEEFFARMIAHHDEPLADSVSMPLYFVARLAQRQKVKVVLIGEAADELFCGYSFYSRILRAQPIFRATQHHVPQFLRKAVARVAYPLFYNKLFVHDALSDWAAGRSFFWSGARVFPVGAVQKIMKKSAQTVDAMIHNFYPDFGESFDAYNMMTYHRSKLRKLVPAADNFQEILYLEFKHRIPELLLMRVDKMTMATHVEGREPFLDTALVEQVARMPQDLKYRAGIAKYLLKKVAEPLLPHDLLYRKKVGFSAPKKRWFARNSFFRAQLDQELKSPSPLFEFLSRDAARALVKDHDATQRHADQLWSLMNLCAWARDCSDIAL